MKFIPLLMIILKTMDEAHPIVIILSFFYVWNIWQELRFTWLLNVLQVQFYEHFYFFRARLVKKFTLNDFSRHKCSEPWKISTRIPFFRALLQIEKLYCFCFIIPQTQLITKNSIFFFISFLFYSFPLHSYISFTYLLTILLL